MAATPFDATVTPTAVGQRVRFLGHGGDVRLWMSAMAGTVARFNRNGYPVVALDEGLALSHTGKYECEVTDRYDCARLIDTDGNWIRPDSQPSARTQ